MGWIKSFSRGNCDLLLRLKAQLACLYLIYTRTIQEEIKVSCSVSQKLKTIFYKLVNDIYVQCWIYDVHVQAEIRCWVSLQNVLKEFMKQSLHESHQQTTSSARRSTILCIWVILDFCPRVGCGRILLDINKMRWWKQYYIDPPVLARINRKRTLL